MFNRDITACFTGHRTYDGSRNSELESAIRELYAEGYRIFLCGMAIGFDIESAEVALALREELAGVKVVAIIPFEGMQRGFSGSWQSRFESIVAETDEVITLATRYSATVYVARNNFLVEHSTACIAYFNGSKGGTAYTVKKAVKGLLRLINLYHNPQRQLFAGE